MPAAPTASLRVPVAAWLAGALLAGTLAAFDPGGFAAFGPVKWALATTLTLALAAAVLAGPGQAALHRESAYGWVAFLAWGALAAAWGVDPLHAWLGTPDRHLGWLAWTLFGLAYATGQQLDDPGSRRVVLRAAVGAALAVGGYALAEIAGLEPVELLVESGRLGGPFGSPAYLGAAGTLLLPVAAGLALDGDERGGWRWAALAGAALLTVAVLGSQSRAALVGLAAAGLVLAPRWWPSVRRRWWVAGAAAVLVAVLVGLTPAGDRLVATFDFDDPGTRGRLDEWRVAAAALADRPLLGAGFEGYRIVFPEHVDAGYERRYTRRTTPDRAHNGALDVGVAAGLPGVLLYLAAAGFLGRRACRAAGGPAWLAGVGAGVAAYLVQQQFLFPLAEVDPAFWLLAGVLVGATGTRALALPAGRAAAGVAALAAVVALTAGALDVLADRDAAAALGSDDPARALAVADRAASLRPDSIRYAFLASTVAARQGPQLALPRLENALALSPRDPILRAAGARYLADLAALTGAPDDLDDAITAWSALVAYDPNNAAYRLQHGVVLARAGDPSAEVEFLAAEDLAPASPVPAVNLAVLYLVDGRRVEAAAAAERARAIDPEAPGLAEVDARLAEAAS